MKQDELNEKNKEKSRELMFKYLLANEKLDRDFTFGAGSNGSMWISYPGYNHMNLEAIESDLIKCFGLRYDFDHKGGKDFDKYCGKTFVYFRDVYEDDSEEEAAWCEAMEKAYEEGVGDESFDLDDAYCK